MLEAKKIKLDGKILEIIDNQLCIDGKSLKTSILEEIITDYKSLKSLHKQLKGDESKLYKLLNKEISFAEQLEAVLQAFEGNRTKLDEILGKIKELRIKISE